ncbi:MAG: hypothetical protein JOZ73_00620, partial [Solirubrobacterales bacterium]|nr:hypothetical protein [Solirubrobacterales bacterium]
TTDLDIAGPGVRALTVSGERRSRVFVIPNSSKVRISSLTITNGFVHGSDGKRTDNGGSVEGGAVLNRGSLTLDAVEVSASKAEGGSGGNGWSFYSAGSGGNGTGGGIFSSGSLALTQTLVVGNVAHGGFGGDAGTRYGHAGEGGNGAGGGLFAQGPLTVTGSRIAGNRTGGGEGGADTYLEGRDRRGGTASGAGIMSSGAKATINSSTIETNTAQGGPGPFAGHAYGGGIRSNGGTSELEVTSSTITGNLVKGGNGYRKEPRPVYVRGGGIFNEQRPLVVLRSAVYANAVERDRGANDYSIIAGGGIANSAGGNLMLTLSTITRNRAEVGGGIDSREGASRAAATSDTVAANEAQSNGGANVANFDGQMTFRNTIVAAPNGSATNCTGQRFTSLGFNLEQGNSCGFNHAADKPNSNPALGPLQNNGGPTRTMSIAKNSPATDQGVSAELTADQRGMQRPVVFGIPRPPGGDGSDIGAFELQ